MKQISQRDTMNSCTLFKSSWVSKVLGILITWLYRAFLFSAFLLFWRPGGELQSMDSTFFCQFIFQQSVDHAVPCDLHLALKSRRRDDHTGNYQRLFHQVEK